MKKISIYIVLAVFLLASCSKKTTDQVIDSAKDTAKEMVDKVDPALAWRSKAPGAGAARPINLGHYTASDLDNGLKVIVVENHKLPRVSYQLSLIHI